MQDLEELLAQMAHARKIYGKEPVAPYHGDNRVSGFEPGYLTSKPVEMSVTDVLHLAPSYHGTWS